MYCRCINISTVILIAVLAQGWHKCSNSHTGQYKYLKACHFDVNTGGIISQIRSTGFHFMYTYTLSVSVVGQLFFTRLCTTDFWHYDMPPGEIHTAGESNYIYFLTATVVNCLIGKLSFKYSLAAKLKW